MHTEIIKHFEIGLKSDVTTIAMATMTIQDGGYLGFRRVLL